MPMSLTQQSASVQVRHEMMTLWYRAPELLMGDTHQMYVVTLFLPTQPTAHFDHTSNSKALV